MVVSAFSYCREMSDNTGDKLSDSEEGLFYRGCFTDLNGPVFTLKAITVVFTTCNGPSQLPTDMKPLL